LKQTISTQSLVATFTILWGRWFSSILCSLGFQVGSHHCFVIHLIVLSAIQFVPLCLRYNLFHHFEFFKFAILINSFVRLINLLFNFVLQVFIQLLQNLYCCPNHHCFLILVSSSLGFELHFTFRPILGISHQKGLFGFTLGQISHANQLKYFLACFLKFG